MTLCFTYKDTIIYSYFACDIIVHTLALRWLATFLLISSIALKSAHSSYYMHVSNYAQPAILFVMMSTDSLLSWSVTAGSEGLRICSSYTILTYVHDYYVSSCI